MIPRKPETLAWIVLWASFVACIALAIAVPVTGRWYMATATDSQEATLEIIGGTVLVQDTNTRTWIGASNKMRVREGDGIRTDDVSRAMVTLFDGSPIVLYPRTEVFIVRSQVNKFEPKTNFVTLRVQRGYLRVAVAPQLKAAQAFVVQTPHGTATLVKDGSYSVEVTDAGSHIAVREGEAKVAAAGGEVGLRSGQRTLVEPGKRPSMPQRAARELVANGDFPAGDGRLEGAVARRRWPPMCRARSPRARLTGRVRSGSGGRAAATATPRPASSRPSTAMCPTWSRSSCRWTCSSPTRVSRAAGSAAPSTRPWCRSATAT